MEHEWKKLDNQDAGYRDGQINTQDHLQLGYLIKDDNQLHSMQIRKYHKLVYK